MSVGIFLQDDGTFDLAVSGGTLAPGSDLETAVLLSLFSDARVSAEEVPDMTDARRGFWGDMLDDPPGDRFGSKLWLLARGKRTLETLRRGEDYAKAALQWLIDDGVASDVRAAASYQGALSQGQWTLGIEIDRPSGATLRYDVLWDEQRARRG